MEKNTAERILDAICDLHAQEQLVTRESLEEQTGLSRTIIDNRISELIDAGRVVRVQRGIYRPAPQHKPARTITKTLLPDGYTLIEIGDQAITLTPRENRMLGELMAGAGQQYASIETGQQAALIAGELYRQVADLRKKLEAVARVQTEGKQGSLLEAG